MKSKQTGIALILAWPETYCKKAGSWYDGILEVLRISNNCYYKVGHAAIVLIDFNSSVCHYFDFGRYHTPFGYGRVRSEESDHELSILTKAIFNEMNELQNSSEILYELSLKEECHGTGSLHASIYDINFENALKKAKNMEIESPIEYGPFIKKGTNCSRFVRSVMIAGSVSKLNKLKLQIPLTVTPTPLGNVNNTGKSYIICPSFELNSFLPKKQSKSYFLRTLVAPRKPHNLSEKAQWLAGEGGGSWFEIQEHSNLFKVLKSSPNGNVESDGLYLTEDDFDIKKTYEIIYPSNSNKVSIMQNNKKVVLIFKEK